MLPACRVWMAELREWFFADFPVVIRLPRLHFDTPSFIISHSLRYSNQTMQFRLGYFTWRVLLLIKPTSRKRGETWGTRRDMGRPATYGTRDMGHPVSSKTKSKAADRSV